MRVLKHKKTGEYVKSLGGRITETTWSEAEDPLGIYEIVEVEVIDKKELEELKEKAWKYDQLNK